jgi:hypothetical protein
VIHLITNYQESDMYKETDIAYEKGNYWALKVKYGFDVYKIGITHSTRVARIGFQGERGVAEVKEEIARREEYDSSTTLTGSL